MDNYCSQKFWYLQVDIEKQESQSCCTATIDPIDIPWLKNNSGQLFNTPALKNDRKILLEDKRVPSCAVCWEAEDRGVVSRRQRTNSQVVTHSDLNSTLKVLNIVIGSDCNLTCSYCCKQYSSAWSSDLVNNGEYQVSNTNRYSMTKKDKVIYKLSQKEITKSSNRRLLLEETALLSAETIFISGGEPFLNLDLANLVSKLSFSKSLEIFTGLGVNTHRFTKEIEKIKEIPNVTLVVSAENIGSHYEFNRHGNSYTRFLDNLEVIKKSGIPFKFASVLSNITLFGLVDFLKEFKDCDIGFNICNDPNFLSVNVLDDESKFKLSESLDNIELKIPGLIESINAPCDQMQKQQAAIFIKEFASRRNLSLDIFPKSFIDWINE